jgi:hypothetical protein
MLVMAYGHSYKLPFITTRGNNVYGECRDVLINWCSSWQSGSPAYIGVSLTEGIYGSTLFETLICKVCDPGPEVFTKGSRTGSAQQHASSGAVIAAGPNQFPEKLIPKFMLLAMAGKPLPIHGDGCNVRSYLYCEDVAGKPSGDSGHCGLLLAACGASMMGAVWTTEPERLVTATLNFKYLEGIR